MSYKEAACLLSQLCGMWYVQTDTVASNWHCECVSEFLNKIDNTSCQRIFYVLSACISHHTD